MQLTEQHVIDRNDQRYAVIDAAAFKSKNLYNAALYLIRQAYIFEGRYIGSYEKAISKKGLKQGVIQPSMLPISIKTQHKHIDQVRIVPRNGYYVVEVIYTKEPIQANVDSSFCVGIDLGVTNLAAIASNREGFVPRLVNGRPVKAWNQWYNKRMKELKKKLPKEDRERVTKQMERITNTRNRRIDHYLHTASKRIVDFLVENGIGTVLIGKNPLWKQESGMSRQNNQNFVSIPHARFIDMLTYKAALVGIQVEIREESYTSKASFLDLDPIPTYTPHDEEEHIFSGKRIGRRNRLYRTKDGRKICADINGNRKISEKLRLTQKRLA
ncbi:MAG: IS200/IS605 family element transposase accessory protein TnpB [Chloroflexi bacterium]|nr:MAG: IS200/IS605 family element transposase accessory protein TnpB [Chloroflexota bacterium]